MIKPFTLSSSLRRFYLGAALLLSFTVQLHAQYMNLSLDVGSKIVAHTNHDLSFGTLLKNSGLQRISLGSSDMGIFSVTGLVHQTVLVDLNMPSQLHHTNPSVHDKIPADFQTRYGFHRSQPQHSFPLNNISNTVYLAPNNNKNHWISFYIFVYGSLSIGDISDGLYEGQAVLNVEYM